jgi:hypothetical protein
MAAVVTSSQKRWDWRGIMFRVITLIVALMYGSAIRLALAPWIGLLDYQTNIQNPEIHLWHAAVTGAVTGILGGGSMLALLWRPRAKPLLVQYWAVAVALGVLMVAPFVGPLMFLVALPALVVVLAYPARRALLDFSGEGPVSRPMLALSVVALVLLAPMLGRMLMWQIQGVGGEHATANQWISDVEHTVLLLLAGFMSSTKRPGWRTLGILTGIAFIYLGVAALTVPTLPGSWGITGGILALIGGAGYIAATVLGGARHHCPSLEQHDKSF